MSSLFLSQDDQNTLCEKFKELVSYTKKNFSFYKDLYHHIDETSISHLNDMKQFPILDKHFPKISTLVDEVLDRQPPAYFETSGTTGNPFPVIPDLGSDRSSEFASFISEWLSLDKTEIKRALIALPFEMNPIGLKYLTALNQLNIMVIPAGVKTHLCPPKKIIEILQRLKPELLVARPLETLRYAEAMIAQGLDPRKSSIKKIILTGEIISKSKYERISKMYGGASVHGVYGLTELDSGGLVSCSKYQYHLPTKPYLIVELLKDDFINPVQTENEIGNIVLTNTHKNYMPLLRYKTGDFGRLQSNCGCEYDTPVINVMGRSADAIECKHSKKRIFPIQIEDILFQFDEIACDYQIITKDGSIELRVETLQVLEQKRMTELTQQIKDKIQSELSVTVDDIHIFMPNQMVDKLGIAKSKAGTLYILDGMCETEMNERLQVNFSC